ncbi:UNVERIFIED_CONTAM: hypothetical protein HDU68_010112, partial [Siphonaria sp. JEL0065]
ETNVFDGFIVKISGESGKIIASHSGFVGLTKPTAKSINSVFIVSSIALDTCSKHTNSYIIAGETYTTESLKTSDVRAQVATSHIVRINEKTTNVFETIQKSSTKLGVLSGPSVSTSIADDVVIGLQVVVMGDYSGQCGYVASASIISPSLESKVETLSFKNAESNYNSYIFPLTDKFEFGQMVDFPTVISQNAIHPPSIASVSSEFVYVSGSVKDTKKLPKVIDGTAFTEKAPFNYLIGFNVVSNSAMSKTEVPHPPELTKLHPTLQIAAEITIRSVSASADSLLAFSGLNVVNKDGSIANSNGGAWFGVLDLKSTVAYSEGFISGLEELKGGEASNSTSKGDVAGVSLVLSESAQPSATVSSVSFSASASVSSSSAVANVATSTSEPKLTKLTTTTSVYIEEDEVSPPTPLPIDEELQDPYADDGDSPVLQPVLDEDETIAEEIDRPFEDDRLFLSTESYVIAILVAIAFVVIFLFYSAKKTRAPGSSNAEFRGTLMSFFNTIFNPSPRGEYAATSKSEDDESLIGMASRNVTQPQQRQQYHVPSVQRVEGTVSPVTKSGKSILAPVQRKLSLEPASTSAVTALRNDTVIAMPAGVGYLTKPNEDAVPLTSSNDQRATESWDWEDDDFADNGTNLDNLATSPPLADDLDKPKDSKEDDEWGW